MRNRTLLVAGVAVAVLALTGCAPTSISGSAAPVGASSGSSSHTGTTTVHSVADLGAAVRHGATAKNSVHVRMRMTVPGAGAITASGDMKFAGAKTAISLTMNEPTMGNLRMVLLDGTLYMKLPAAMAGLVGGSDDKPWLKLAFGADNPITQALGANFTDELDPTKLLDQFKSAGTITKVTHETLNGQQTTHYAITVDVAKLGGTDQSLSGLTASTIPFDIWVNSDNLPVRIVSKMGFASPGGSSQEAVLTADYTNWGQPVTITAPPADQVGTFGVH
ncbi:MAG TPA: hypothetical protein VFX16_19405 [Pseudonocardiaceae bacterium]|nr:hypothetical protein [Pseudonocardiaceae bacterium]